MSTYHARITIEVPDLALRDECLKQLSDGEEYASPARAFEKWITEHLAKFEHGTITIDELTYDHPETGEQQ